MAEFQRQQIILRFTLNAAEFDGGMSETGFLFFYLGVAEIQPQLGVRQIAFVYYPEVKLFFLERLLQFWYLVTPQVLGS